MHFEEGRYAEVDLAGLDVAVLFDTPQHMIAGGWTTAMFLDHRSTPEQKAALETILSGGAGGPWKVLDRFVARRLETRVVPIRFEDLGKQKRMSSEGIFDLSVAAIRSADGSGEATLSNLFNQIHQPRQVLALGETRCVDPEFPLESSGTHALYSRFSWGGEVSTASTASTAAGPAVAGRGA